MDAQNEVVKFKLEEEKEEVNGGKEKFLEKKGSSFKKSGFFELALTSFKEDSYFISDLRESERKALHEFKEKIDNAIKANQFLVDTAEEGNAKEDHNAATSKEVKAEKPTNQDTNNPDQNGGGTENKSENGKNGAEVVQSHGNDDISIWGIPLLHTKGDERTDVILLKFLRARDFRVNDTFVMLQNCIAWRKKFGADNILEEDLAFDENLDSVAFMHCSDKDGHPVCYNAYGVFRDKDIYQKIFGDDEKLKKFLRWRVQILEKGIKLLNFKPGGVNAMIQITDLKNMPKRELRTASNQILALFQDNYPEMVAKKFVGFFYALGSRGKDIHPALLNLL